MRNLIFIISISLIIFSCKKSTVVENPCKPKPAAVAGTYKKTAEKYKESSAATEQDWFSGLLDCQKDDTYELKPDSTVVVSVGAAVCPGPPPPGGITSWYLDNNNTLFVLDAIYEIISFDCRTLVVVEKDFLVSGDIRTVTYVKQ